MHQPPYSAGFAVAEATTKVPSNIEILREGSAFLDEFEAEFRL